VTPLDVVTIVALLVVLAADITFIALNHAWTAWRSNPWGRHVMFFSYTLAALLTFGMARLLFGDYPGRRELLACLYVVLAGVMVQRVWLVVREHRRR
jgi:hypothetical protein